MIAGLFFVHFPKTQFRKTQNSVPKFSNKLSYFQKTQFQKFKNSDFQKFQYRNMLFIFDMVIQFFQVLLQMKYLHIIPNVHNCYQLLSIVINFFWINCYNM